MRVALDGTPLLGARTGVGEVVAGFVGALAARPDVDVVAYAVTWAGRDRLAAVLPPPVTPATRPFPARLVRELWQRVPEPRVERWTGAVDVVHALNFVAPPARVPVMVMVHDLTFVRFPELCTRDTLRYPAAIRRALARGAHVHVPSDFVAAEVQEEFGLGAERVTRIHSGLAPTAGGDAAAGRRLAGAERYVLALGTVEPRKNLPVLVDAFDAVAAEDPDVRLVVAGPDGWGMEAYTAAVDARRAPRPRPPARMGRRRRPPRPPRGRGRVRVPVALRGVRTASARGDGRGDTGGRGAGRRRPRDRRRRGRPRGPARRRRAWRTRSSGSSTTPLTGPGSSPGARRAPPASRGSGRPTRPSTSIGSLA